MWTEGVLKRFWPIAKKIFDTSFEDVSCYFSPSPKWHTGHGPNQHNCQKNVPSHGRVRSLEADFHSNAAHQYPSVWRNHKKPCPRKSPSFFKIQWILKHVVFDTKCSFLCFWLMHSPFRIPWIPSDYIQHGTWKSRDYSWVSSLELND